MFSQPLVFDNCQQALIVLLIGTSAERHYVGVESVLKAKPASVTWQHMLDACFTPEMRRPLTELLAKRNRRAA